MGCPEHPDPSRPDPDLPAPYVSAARAFDRHPHLERLAAGPTFACAWQAAGRSRMTARGAEPAGSSPASRGSTYVAARRSSAGRSGRAPGPRSANPASLPKVRPHVEPVGSPSAPLTRGPPGPLARAARAARLATCCPPPRRSPSASSPSGSTRAAGGLTSSVGPLALIDADRDRLYFAVAGSRSPAWTGQRYRPVIAAVASELAGRPLGVVVGRWPTVLSRTPRPAATTTRPRVELGGKTQRAPADNLEPNDPEATT
jgi:hypothetical protein